MTLNKKIIFCLFYATLFMTLSSCDNISEQDRYLEVEKPVVPPHSVPKTLLIQEFSGIRCTNCPDGAAALKDITEAYPGQMISVGMHPQNNVNTRPRNGFDLTCEEATVMYDYYKPSGFPCAVFNGTELSTTYNTWFTIASEQLNEVARMEIEPMTLYDEDARYLTIEYAVTFTDDINEPLSIMVWIIENKIIGAQLNHGEWIEDYEHNHVLRASANGEWGQSLQGPYKNGQTIEGTTAIKLDDEWIAENCEVVLYVFQNDSKMVEQTNIIEIFPQ